MFSIITASPNSDGLTAACAKSALKGFVKAQVDAEIIDLFSEKIQGCRACDNGWGKCLKENQCIIDDGLKSIQKKLSAASGIFLITPVYFGQPSEKMKYFLDRLRRCEAFRKGGSFLADKRITLVAAAGGSGNGAISCLADMEVWCRHVKAVPEERIPITRFNREIMLAMIELCASKMSGVSSRYL